MIGPVIPDGGERRAAVFGLVAAAVFACVGGLSLVAFVAVSLAGAL